LPYYGTGVTACASTAYHGSGKTPVEPYAFWSTATPAINLTLDIREKGIDYDALRALISQWRSVNRYYYGDYYPLTPYSHDEAVWIAWQFHDAEADAGMLQAFRRGDSVYRTADLNPRSLAPDAIYKVTDLASGKMIEMTGDALMKSGVSVTIDTQPGVAVTVYNRAD
jgi:alpha-galactosidase